MNSLRWSLLLTMSASSIACADTVKLTNDRTIENVRVSREGKNLRLERDNGSIVVRASDVIEIVPKELPSEELAKRKLAAGNDPKALRELARWCGEKGLRGEQTDILALARGIELDAKLERLAAAKTAQPFIALSREMRAEGYSEAERTFVIGLALERDPDNAAAHAELGEVKRAGAWVSFAEAARLDALEEERTMTARGYVRFEGSWRTPAQVEAIRQQRRVDAELAARERARRAQAEAELAALERARRDTERSTYVTGGYSGSYTGAYARTYVIGGRHAVHYTWDPPHSTYVGPVHTEHHERPRPLVCAQPAPAHVGHGASLSGSHHASHHGGR